MSPRVGLQRYNLKSGEDVTWGTKIDGHVSRFPVFWRRRKAIILTMRGENPDLGFKSRVSQTCFAKIVCLVNFTFEI